MDISGWPQLVLRVTCPQIQSSDVVTRAPCHQGILVLAIDSARCNSGSVHMFTLASIQPNLSLAHVRSSRAQSVCMFTTATALATTPFQTSSDRFDCRLCHFQCQQLPNPAACRGPSSRLSHAQWIVLPGVTDPPYHLSTQSPTVTSQVHK